MCTSLSAVRQLRTEIEDCSDSCGCPGYTWLTATLKLLLNEKASDFETAAQPISRKQFPELGR
jgi:hypothetical protein